VSAEPIVEAVGLHKSFHTETARIDVLRDVNLSLAEGERIAILGQSGVGKSTLLHVLGGLDRPSAGQVLFRGRDLGSYDPLELAAFRNRSLGFVFQFHHLLPEFTALENVMMPGLIGGVHPKEMAPRAAAILDEVGLSARAAHRVGKLSGGERQRVAVARALVLGPEVVLADEPTGNLDPETGERVAGLLLDLNRQRGAALVVVTHSERLAERLGRRVVLTEEGAFDESASPGGSAPASQVIG
jgi:lipoprotein-releasing system ATP-binding protein